MNEIRKELEQQKQQVLAQRSETETKLAEVTAKEQQLEEETLAAQQQLKEQEKAEQEAADALSQIRMEEAGFDQKAGFIRENIKRVDAELAKLQEELTQLENGAKNADADVSEKEQQIQTLRTEIQQSGLANTEYEQQLEEKLKAKEAMTEEQKGFFQKREELSERKTILDKEIFRLNSQKEKLEETRETQTNYMWNEYELTPHHAIRLRDDQYSDPVKTKNQIRQTKEEIRKLGDVNVNAIEEYKEVSERYEFLKTQHDDLIQAEQTLLGIIEELDTGMRRQFSEKFAEIQREFDKAFQQLFGGGKGTLELAEGEEILECGIRIIAHLSLIHI